MRIRSPFNSNALVNCELSAAIPQKMYEGVMTSDGIEIDWTESMTKQRTKFTLI